MYIIKPYETAVTLFHVDGNVCTYPSLRAALKDLDLAWISRNVGEHFVRYTHTESCWRDGERVKGERIYQTHSFIMRNDEGKPVTRADFGDLVPKSVPWYRRSYLEWSGQGPVPGTRKPKAGTDLYQRGYPARVRRTTFTVLEEGEVRPRPKQDMGYLYDDPWDWYSYDRCNRSWKHYRNQQWRE